VLAAPLHIDLDNPVDADDVATLVLLHARRPLRQRGPGTERPSSVAGLSQQAPPGHHPPPAPTGDVARAPPVAARDHGQAP